MQIITNSGIIINRKEIKLDKKTGIFFITNYLETQKGMFLSSGTEYPGRYSRWETGFYAPPVEINAFADSVLFKPLNKRGAELVNIFETVLKNNNGSEYTLSRKDKNLLVQIIYTTELFREEYRSKQASVLTPIRTVLSALKHNERDVLGFYGAFGFDLLFQFEKMELVNKRDENQPVVRLFFPDKIYTYDRKKEETFVYEYDFEYGGFSTSDIPFESVLEPEMDNDTELKTNGEIETTLTDKEYAGLVDKAREHMHSGNIFELVLRRKFYASYTGSTSKLFKKMVEINPSPYQFFCQFIDEQLVGTSPEMFVRVTGNRVETCPISGTIKRGLNPIEDEKQIRSLLNSQKDEVELTMCTDVDRNDKSRVCKAGSIRLLGRRQIEKYRGLFHTVDHVEGILRDDCDGIDAFLSHMWAVTLMGSPKSTAVRLIEEYESEPRKYYGGAIGVLFCNGNLNTGITIRTIHIKNGIADYSVGASLVYDSDGADEAKETRIKSTSFFNLFRSKQKEKDTVKELKGSGLKIVVIDNQDSFVNILSDYFRQTGADVVTYRSGVSPDVILSEKPDLVMHSPGPKLPEDFNVPELVRMISGYNIPQFGVCLGLQGIVEAFGGKLRRIDIPHHGKKWTITHNNENIFSNLPQVCEVGAYHSWVADESCLPECLKITASNKDGMIMGISHKEKPIWAVQFHPESIMSMENDLGHKIIANVIECVKRYKNDRKNFE
ncbi:MAG: anthranilate synthase component I [Candidatus Gastranaerophilales bacterium]|nr:anthranilate synthase component I [Candidatus Gastranaerophilales bacterium]